MNQKYHDYIINFGLTDEEYKIIRPSLVESNYRNLLILGAVADLFLAFLIIISIIFYDDYSWIAYLASFCICLAANIMNLLITKKNSSALKYFVYMTIVSLIGNGIAMGVVFEKSNPAVSFICYLIILPFVFNERPYRMVISQLLLIIIYLVLAINLKEASVLKTDLINVTLFGGVSIVVSLFLGRKKIVGHLNEYKVNALARVDVLTGLRNRTSYEEMLKEYPKIIKKTLSCIYVDLNGLHETNNSKGHEEGDKMIVIVANALKEAIGENNVYRTGGDEFVGFVIDCDKDHAENIIENVRKSIKEHSFSIAAGITYLEKKDIDMHLLVSTAELKMYEDKEKYYNDNGDREVRFLKESKE